MRSNGPRRSRRADWRESRRGRFTSGGTEATNMAIRGPGARPGAACVVTTAIEHPATEACCALLAREGYEIRRVAPGADGRVAAEDMAAASMIDRARDDDPCAERDRDAAARRRGRQDGQATWRTGACRRRPIARQGSVDVDALGVDLLSIAGHKLYAPKGVGALYIGRECRFPRSSWGHGQESGRRPGTENVAYFVGLGAACRIAADGLAERERSQRALADRLLCRGSKRDDTRVELVGHRTERLPNTLNVLFPGVSGREVLPLVPAFLLHGLGLPCGPRDPSAVLTSSALRPPRRSARSGYRWAAQPPPPTWHLLPGSSPKPGVSFRAQHCGKPAYRDGAGQEWIAAEAGAARERGARARKDRAARGDRRDRLDPRRGQPLQNELPARLEPRRRAERHVRHAAGACRGRRKRRRRRDVDAARRAVVERYRAMESGAWTAAAGDFDWLAAQLKEPAAE